MERNWTEKRMVRILSKNDQLVEHAMVILWQKQTQDEQKVDNTKHRNCVGFSAADAKKGSYYAKWVLGLCTRDGQPGRLTGHHLDRARKLACKYRRQLTEMTNDGEARALYEDAVKTADKILRKKRLQAHPAANRKFHGRRAVPPMPERDRPPYCSPADSNARNDRWLANTKWHADRGNKDAQRLLKDHVEIQAKQAIRSQVLDQELERIATEKRISDASAAGVIRDPNGNLITTRAFVAQSMTAIDGDGDFWDQWKDEGKDA